MVTGPVDLILRLFAALDICQEVALFIKYGSGGWTRQRRIDRWRAKREERT